MIARSQKIARKTSLYVPDATVGEMTVEGAVADVAQTAPKLLFKITHILALLRRPEGATLAQLVEITGWQPHTTRAALDGPRKI